MFHPGLFHDSIPTSALLLQESEMDSNKQPDSPSEEEPSTPRAVSTSQNPKYQLFLNNEMKTNGVSGRDADGPGGGGSVGENGSRLSRWETNRLGPNHYRGSLESLASRDWDTMSDRVSEVDHGLCLCVIQIREIGDCFYDNQMLFYCTQNQLLYSAISWTKHSLKVFYHRCLPKPSFCNIKSVKNLQVKLIVSFYPLFCCNNLSFPTQSSE